jgi:pyoverdine/dityrosine biosynthesis protein Dit1
MIISLSRSFRLLIIALPVLLSFFMIHSHIKNENSSIISQHIYTILDQYRITYDIDQRSIDPSTTTDPREVHGSKECIQNIAHFVANNVPITMLMVGFPFKSSNREKKVIGHLPDMAERKSLEYLQKMLDEIAAIYKPGANILVFCDGVVFAEYFDIPLSDVTAYETALKKLAADMPHITIFSSGDVMQKHGLKTASEIITLIDNHEPSDTQFRAKVTSVPETALKRIGFELDHTQGKILVEKYGLDEIVMQLLAREMRLRTYIEKTFPVDAFFRLTVHFSSDLQKKFGIRLSPTSDITPYHGVLVEEKDSSWSIQFKKDIDTQNYTLCSLLVNEILCHYFKRK